LTVAVTLLAIFASDAIALPLSPSFPTRELKYILDNSQAKVLLATEKYAGKAMDILHQGLEREPLFNIRNKLMEGAARESVTLEELKKPAGGMMLYTSGTTNRPVRSCPFQPKTDPSNPYIERRTHSTIGTGSTSLIPLTSMEVLPR
jgi:acyl-CoA synthetase (AMP-forming)/AMP-acid ligase II